MSTNTRTRWLALFVLCLGELMIVLDTPIVNVALPSSRTGRFHGFRVQVPSDTVIPHRCPFPGMPGSAADGHGTPASFKARAIRAAEWQARRWAKIQRTTGAVRGSGSRRCARRPHAA
jgi:hypothetical protein